MTRRTQQPRPIAPSRSADLRHRHGLARSALAEADQREMPERRHGAALDQVNAVGAPRPFGVTRPGELGAPAELARRRREPMLQRAPQAGFRADAADQDDLAAGLEHASELVERRL